MVHKQSLPRSSDYQPFTERLELLIASRGNILLESKVTSNEKGKFEDFFVFKLLSLNSLERIFVCSIGDVTFDAVK